MIDASKPYEVGKSYDVTVAITTGRLFGIADWPIIGPLHNDREIIGFKSDHYHIDWRFVSEARIKRVVGPFLVAGQELGSVIDAEIVLEKQVRTLKCRRPFVAFPNQLAWWMPELERAYQSGALGPKRICPHRGADLSTIEPVDGLITCPLHGLKWCAHTGQLQPSSTLTIS